MNTSWWFSRAVGAASANSPPARSVSRSGRLHVDPSKLARPLTRQYAGSVARTTNSSVSERLTRRDRMSTSGLPTDPGGVVGATVTVGGTRSMRIESSTSAAKSASAPADGSGHTPVLMTTIVPSRSRTHKVSIQPGS